MTPKQIEEMKKYKALSEIGLDSLVPQHLACLLVGMNRSTLYKKREAGRFPKPVISEGRDVRYRLSDLNNYVTDPQKFYSC